MRLTLPQVLEWIIYFDRCLVDRRMTVFDVLNDSIRAAGDDDEKAHRPLKARDELIQRLRGGELAAYGVPSGKHLHEPIPSVHWEKLDSLTNLPNSIGPDDVGQDERILYRNVLVEMSEMMRLWPARSIGAAAFQHLESRELPSGHGVSQKKVDAALLTVSNQYEASGTRPSEKELLTAVRKIVGEHARREQLRDARKRGCVHDNWRRAGARKKLRK